MEKRTRNILIGAGVAVVIIIIIVLIIVFTRPRTPATAPATPATPATPAAPETPAAPAAPAPAAPAPGATNGGTTNGTNATPKWVPTNYYSCFPNVLTPTRVNATGDIQCDSTDGTNCDWTSNITNCNTDAARQNRNTTNIDAGLTPVVCTPDQYKNPIHWCYLAGNHYTKQS